MLTAHPVPGKAKSKMICEAFIAGAPRDAKGHVFYGVTEGNADWWWNALKHGLPFWYIDNSYFDKVRGQQFRVTRNHIQHTGLGETDGKRFEALGIDIAPVRGGEHRRVLGVEQSPLFMKLIARDVRWLPNAMEREFDMDQWTTTRVRPWNRDKTGAGQTLQEELRTTDVLITHSSAAATEAVLAGVDVVTSPASAAWHLGIHRGDRRQWAGVLADNQFTLDEMKDGTAWHMLTRN